LPGSTVIRDGEGGVAMPQGYAVVRQPVNPRRYLCIPAQKPRFGAAGSTQEDAQRTRAPRHVATGKSLTQGQASGGGGVGTLRHRCLDQSSDERGPPTALLDHRKHASDERKDAAARGRVDLGDGGGSYRADSPAVFVGDGERF